MNKASINGIDLAYEDRGNGDPILCIHGFPLSHALWLPAAESLGDRYRFIMPDLRGMGQSGVTDEASMQIYAEDLAALLDHLKIDGPVTVMGLSMGGYVAFEFVRRFAQRVSKLVLVDTQAGADSDEKKQERATVAQKVLSEGVYFVADGMLPKLFAKNADTELLDRWHAILSATEARGVAAALHAMASRPDSRESFGDIRVPTLVVVGEEDAITPPELSKEMAAGIAGARLEIVPGAGHMVPVEAPAVFNDILADFLG